jgi:hypothetical protein
MLIQSGGFSWAIIKAHASARSSTWRNSLLGVPVPQALTSPDRDSLASWNLRMRAGRTWEFLGW